MYEERSSQFVWDCRCSIQTSVRLDWAAHEFSWDHPTFTGTLEVVGEVEADGGILLMASAYAVSGPGHMERIAGPMAPGISVVGGVHR